MVLLPLLRVLRACGLAALVALVALAVCVADPGPALAAFVLPPLPYPADALAPAIEPTTMTIHHDRHHGAYVANLNARITDHPELEGMALEDLQGRISRYPAAVRNNGGGHYNHSLFWRVMAPPGQGGAPSPQLGAAITAAFGSPEALQQRFARAAADRFGSGWTWLIRRPDGSLAIASTANQDNPLMDLPGIERGVPLLGLDVWEHAYYLDYQNRRPDYIAAWWSLVNWNEVNRRFAAGGGPTTASES
ncbi:superoxide dismutase [Cyanobium gracile]|uniref:Superoxide dismutase n=1 Tax=Cyanobium gracile (strain ATCC 27147 / PCC 6307) TaxID=292564 RepID=K9P548_CYAGP|nr:superoxide dismutase [Cyanobium gracile]AFY28123.1 superoxide dismutase [Cyanobium gracile PCC 6307]